MLRDAENIMHKRWKWRAQPPFHEKCHLDSDAISSRMDIMQVWVRILGISMLIWSEGIFEEIRNVFVTFYEDDLSLRDTSYLGISCIIFGLEIRKCMTNKMDIRSGLNRFHLNIDYKEFHLGVGVSFLWEYSIYIIPH
jgi:hypothetical protein